jgi:hypothetical protein
MGQFKQLEIKFEDEQSGVYNTMKTEITKVDLVAKFVGTLTTKKLHHNQLLLTGTCSSCAHCGMDLTDGLSVQRGLGPSCASKGYKEDPKEGIEPDEMGSMIALAEFPEVCTFLVENYRPQGLRGLMNGIVKISSLNKNNSKLHAACCDAIECLGWIRLANTLRESICVVVIKESTKHPGCIEVLLKRHAFKYGWLQDLKQIPGVFYDRTISRNIIPIKNPIDGSLLTCNFEGKEMTRRLAFWSTLVRWHLNEYGRTVGKSSFKIVPKENLPHS